MAIQKKLLEDVLFFSQTELTPSKKSSYSWKEAYAISPSLFRNYITCKLVLNCKSPSKGYLTQLNYRLFLNVKINSVIIFATLFLNTLFPKFLHQVWFISSSVVYAMNPITENVLDILLEKVGNILAYFTFSKIKGYNLERIGLSVIIC